MQSVEVRCLHHGVREGAQAIVAELIGEDEEDIHGEQARKMGEPLL